MRAAWLAQTFGPDVTQPIALHVEAKRYLCATESGYFDSLSNASRLSLQVQGGKMTQTESDAFRAQPYAEAAILLRRCDDGGKDVSVEIIDLAHYRDLLTSHLR
jgi:gamma-butyrobetaine dioxygenase